MTLKALASFLRIPPRRSYLPDFTLKVSSGPFARGRFCEFWPALPKARQPQDRSIDALNIALFLSCCPGLRGRWARVMIKPTGFLSTVAI
jgi:hypothetical protein